MNCVKLTRPKFIIICHKHTSELLFARFPVYNEASESKNLGVTFDSKTLLTIKVCYAYYYDLRDLQHFYKFLAVDTAVLVLDAMVNSQLDNCNSLLHGVSKVSIAKLQKVQNAVCLIVFTLERMTHVTPCLEKLYWHAISYCILCKYNLLA